MAVDTLRLKINDTPTGRLAPGRGFYQVDEEILFVQVAPFTKDDHFFSYLESRRLRFDIDRLGRLLFIELKMAKRQWRQRDDLVVPEPTPPADIRFLDFRSRINDPEVFCNEDQSLVQLVFDQRPTAGHHRVAGAVTIGESKDGTLTAIWLADIVDDFAGKQIAAYRKRMLREREQQRRHS